MKIDDIKNLLSLLKFEIVSKNIYLKEYKQFNAYIKIDFNEKKIIYPEHQGLKVNDRTTCNFENPENFVVLECIDRLLEKGYRPEHLELEKKWHLGHNQKSGKADICVHDVNGVDMLCIIECKTYGHEYNKEMKNTLNDGGQLFSYWQQERSTKWLILYTSNVIKNEIKNVVESICCTDDANIVEVAKTDASIELYQNANTVKDLYNVWKNTYDRAFYGNVLFNDNTQAYNIGIQPLRKKDLNDFEENNKIVNKFEEILRHNNVSDKENAFNRLIAMFICKLVDEVNKNDNDEVDFQYKPGTDTYESLQDRLQNLHKQGMDEFMKEEIFYIPNDYAEKLVKSYTGQNRENMIKDLQNTLRILKFYTNNDFAFKDVHNEELFYQNGKVVVEVVELFQKYRIIGSNNLQLLGDLFEQLLNKGFKQNEGQFFTPTPITRFIWKSLPLEKLIGSERNLKFPKIIDYACGSGHFLTEGYEQINEIVNSLNIAPPNNWAATKLFGIEKDYRLARVSKISLFMHGAGEGNIVYGDGLENYYEKNIITESFDILVANPPYAVTGFKPHLKLKNNNFNILESITNDGSEIETLFVERINQLIKANGYAAVILPSSILSKEGNSFTKARETIITHFEIVSIVRLGSKTFGATGTNTIILYLKKYDEPLTRSDMLDDSITAIFSNENYIDFEDNEIFNEYLKHININDTDYKSFINKEYDYKKWLNNDYFKEYVILFENSISYKNKIKQSTFQKLDDIEQLKQLNNLFYLLSHAIEKDKMKYFGFVYKQKVLIIYAPDDNKEQETFLGYKWSNRKGQEGIQILNNKGFLYKGQNSTCEVSLSEIIKNHFLGINLYRKDLEKYYYYQDLKDMLNFFTPIFNKTIKINKIRKLKKDKDLKTVKLSDSNFEINIGDRVLIKDLDGSGKYPVYSANVKEIFGYTNKEKITDFSKESILWGIDGDWMVNILPSDYKFYPTDHCGVLRNNDASINNKYLSLALEQIGNIERFSRVNRASTERIKQLVLQIPPIEKQLEVVNYINDVENKIKQANLKIKELDKKILKKFVELFDAEALIQDGVTTKYPKEKIGSIFNDGRGRVINMEYIDNHIGDYPVYSSQTVNDGIFGKIDTYDFEGEYITWTTDGVKAGTVFYRNGKFNCTNVCGTLKLKEAIDNVNVIYASIALGIIAPYHITKVGNNKLMNDVMKKIEIPIPDIELQNEMAKYYLDIKKKMSTQKLKINKMQEERTNLLKKYFD